MSMTISAFTQFFAEVLILATQLLVFFVQGAALGLGATLLWCQGMQDSASLRSASLRSAARAEEYVFVFFMLNFLPRPAP